MAYDNQGMAIGNAAKIAADLTQVAVTHGHDPNQVLGTWALLFSEVTDVVLERQNTGAATERLIEAFDATPIHTPAPTPAPAPAPVPQPAASADPVEQAWNMLFADAAAGRLQENWYTDPKSSRHPDFKHKTFKLPGEQYPVGLYKTSRKNPAWVPQRLAELGL